jgi:hypothetical protein
MSQALQVIPGGQLAPRSDFQLSTIEDVMRLGEVFAKSGFFQDSTQAAQCVVKIMAGKELGIGPFAAMSSLHVIKGKVTLSANLLAQKIKQSGRYDYRILKHSKQECEIEFFEHGQSLGKTSLTFKEAETAGLTKEWDAKLNPAGYKEKYNWKTYPANMLFARCISNGVRWFCPDVTADVAVYTPDEIDAEPQPAQPAAVRPFPVPQPQSAEQPEQPQTEAVEAVALADAETIKAIVALWPEHGPKLRGEKVSLPQYLHEKFGNGNVTSLAADKAAKILDWLQGRANSKAVEQQLAQDATDRLAAETLTEPDKASGLDKWRCTQESGNRAAAMAVLNATERLTKTGVTEDQWRKELANLFNEYEPPISRKTLSPQECELVVDHFTAWAERREGAAAGK